MYYIYFNLYLLDIGVKNKVRIYVQVTNVTSSHSCMIHSIYSVHMYTCTDLMNLVEV